MDDTDLKASMALAATGDVTAMAALGRLFLTRPGMPVIDGVRFTIEASNQGDGEAAHQVAVFSAVGAGVPQNWTGALDLLRRSSELGWIPARRQLMLLTSDREAAGRAASGNDAPELWQRLRDGIDLKSWLTPPPLNEANASPRIWLSPHFLPPEMCDWLVERAKPKMERARVFDAQSGKGAVDKARSNSFTDFNIVDTDVVLAIARARIASAIGLPSQGFEDTAILHYLPGQEFRPHFDFLDTEKPALAQEVALRGQRVASFLIYLNDGFEGGETAFPLISWRHQGAKGEAVAFSNVDGEGGPDRKALHAGLAPSSGEKWLLSQFIRRAPPR